MRARCLAVGGRTRHAPGDLAQAELALSEAFSLAEGADRVTAAAWPGVLRSHQSRMDDALSLQRPAARGQVGAEHTAAIPHALLFTGHSLALARLPGPGPGRPHAAHGRGGAPTGATVRRPGVNFSRWIPRNLGARSEATDHHQEALEVVHSNGNDPRLPGGCP